VVQPQSATTVTTAFPPQDPFDSLNTYENLATTILAATVLSHYCFC
jgi:hypothetical protein